LLKRVERGERKQPLWKRKVRRNDINQATYILQKGLIWLGGHTKKDGGSLKEKVGKKSWAGEKKPCGWGG